MFVASLTDVELQTIIIALKYWRCHRPTGQRRSDRALSPADVDALLAKLATGAFESLPSNALIADASSY
jgi:hypothetical protein